MPHPSHRNPSPPLPFSSSALLLLAAAPTQTRHPPRSLLVHLAIATSLLMFSLSPSVSSSSSSSPHHSPSFQLCLVPSLMPPSAPSKHSGVCTVFASTRRAVQKYSLQRLKSFQSFFSTAWAVEAFSHLFEGFSPRPPGRLWRDRHNALGGWGVVVTTRGAVVALSLQPPGQLNSFRFNHLGSCRVFSSTTWAVMAFSPQPSVRLWRVRHKDLGGCGVFARPQPQGQLWLFRHNHQGR